ncbi:MAG: hypothetical protein RL264_1892 [Bacteroidota bacterium]|jgi:alkaline phosphatase D
MRGIFLIFVVITSFVSFNQENEDDETVYLLKKGLYKYIDSNLLIPKTKKSTSFIRKDIPQLYGCDGSFKHGVASGDPTANAVIIWTRWTPPTNFSGQKSIGYSVSEFSDFSQIVHQGFFTTDSTIDFTVKIDVSDLVPNKVYYYKFFTESEESIIGRTKTLNLNDENVRLAFVNCNDFTKGYFNTFKALADRNDVDAVVHLGDYIYEQGGGENDRAHNPENEIWRLYDYRTRFSQYKLDNYLGRCHQLFPFIQIWDDHDIVVDAVSDTSLRHQAIYGSYQDRKWAAVKAFREWNPIRDDSTNLIKNWRKFSFGSTVELFMIDDRLYDRDRIPESTNDTLYNSTNAKMLGPEQLNWLLANLQQSTAKWKIIANGLMFSQLEALGNPLVLENWDGYNYERNQIFQLLRSQNIKNVIVYSGDFHCAFANDLSDNPFNFLNYNPLNGNGSLAVEFIPPSASSDNFDEGNDFGLGAGNYQLAQSLITTGNPHVKYVNLIDHGYGLLDLNGNRAQNEFWYVTSVFDPAVTSTNCGNLSVVQNNANKISAGGNPVPNGNLGFKPTGCFDDVLGLSTVESSNQMAVLSCFPNPFSSFISFQIMGNLGAKVKVELIDALGKIVEKRDFIQSEVIENFVFESKLDLASGFYTLHVFNEQFSWNKLLLKK